MNKSVMVYRIHCKNPNVEILSLSNNNAHTSVAHCKCLICGYCWSQKARALWKKKYIPCKRCRSKFIQLHHNFKYSTASFSRCLGPNYKCITKYRGCKNYIYVKHLSCGFVWKAKYASKLLVKLHQHRTPYICPRCAKKYSNLEDTYSSQQFDTKLYKLYGEEYVRKSPYINNATNTLFKHNYCGTLFLMKPRDILRGEGCPTCKESKMERFTRYWLHCYGLYQNKGDFIKGMTIHSLLRGFDQKRLDFYLPKYHIAIECDGAQHFHPVCFGSKFHRVDILKFKRQQVHDQVKTIWCALNSIRLIRIKNPNNYNYNRLRKLVDNTLDKKLGSTINEKQ